MPTTRSTHGMQITVITTEVIMLSRTSLQMTRRTALPFLRHCPSPRTTLRPALTLLMTNLFSHITVGVSWVFYETRHPANVPLFMNLHLKDVLTMTTTYRQVYT